MNYRTLLRYVTPPYRTLALVMAILLLNGLVMLAHPWIAGELVRVFIDGAESRWTGVRTILLLWLGLIALRSLLGFASAYLAGNAGADMGSKLRTRVYEHLQMLPLPYHQEQRQGKLLTLFSHDADHISGFVAGTLVRLLPLTITFTGALVIMAWLDPTIALLALLLVPVYYLAMKLIGRKIRPITTDWLESWSSLVSLVQENLALIPVIKAFVREPIETRRFGEQNREMLRLTRRQIVVQSALAPSVSFLAGAGLLLLLWVGIGHVQSGQLHPSALVSLILYAMLLTQPVSGLANVYGQVMRTRGAAERLLRLFAERPEPPSSGRPLAKRFQGAIEFRDISFAYPGRRPVFEHFHLRIAAGETLALTGPNGVGKTTLAYLLMRFADPAGGKILIDGTDIATVEIGSLREQIGLVAQHTLLLNATVAENIAYGRPMATREEIEQAAAAAQAAEFIRAMPQGYDTLIGDQGVYLSGGQRQRLSLARTLLKDPPILILDEATAMMDEAGEANFRAQCRTLLKNRTVLLITHKLTGLEFVDRVVELAPLQPGAEAAGNGATLRGSG